MQKLQKRIEVRVEDTWQTEDIFPSDTAWEEAYKAVKQSLPSVANFQGRLGESADVLFEALSTRDNVVRKLDNLYIYTHLRNDQDTTDSKYQALHSRAVTLYSEASQTLSYMDPELLALPEGAIHQFLIASESLRLYERELSRLEEQRAHILSEKEEQLLARLSEIAMAPQQIFSALNNADLKFPTIRDDEGHEVELTKGRYGIFLESNDRSVRQAAYDAMYDTYATLKNTIAASYAASVKKDVAYAKARNYESALDSALKRNEIPAEVYTNLVSTVNANLPKLHRYLALRKRILGLDTLRPYDLYVPLVPESNRKISFEEAQKAVTEAVKPLGQTYVNDMQKEFDNRWLDIYENEGKRAGAYSSGGYDTNPYILLNYQDRLNDVFTLAHELGHSMHSYYTHTHQPYPYGDYTIFVAEVASTLNESLLTRHYLEQTNDPTERMALLNRQVEEIRTTLYRQTMFAEFELWAHEQVEAGEALTQESMTSAYRDLNARYFGEMVELDDRIAVEWMRIPHFYSAFYVYQYSTGISASIALATQIEQEKEVSVERYLNFLASGCSTDPISLLQGAGVDMLSPNPIEQALDRFDSLVGEMERLYEEIASGK